MHVGICNKLILLSTATDYRASSTITISKEKCGGSLQVHITWSKSGSSIPSWVPTDLPLSNEAYQKGAG